MASLKVKLIHWLLVEGAEDRAGNVLLTKYCGITYCVCVCVCVCVYACLTFSGMQSACAVLQCHLRSVRLYIFSHYFINSAILEKGILNTKRVF